MMTIVLDFLNLIASRYRLQHAPLLPQSGCKNFQIALGHNLRLKMLEMLFSAGNQLFAQAGIRHQVPQC